MNKGWVQNSFRIVLHDDESNTDKTPIQMCLARTYVFVWSLQRDLRIVGVRTEERVNVRGNVLLEVNLYTTRGVCVKHQANITWHVGWRCATRQSQEGKQ